MISGTQTSSSSGGFVRGQDDVDRVARHVLLLDVPQHTLVPVYDERGEILGQVGLGEEDLGPGRPPDPKSP